MPILHDLKSAFRSLIKSPGFTSAAVLTLALGIGANTAVFSLVDRMLLRPLPFPEAQRLVAMREFNPERPMRGGGGFSYPNFLDFQRQSTQLASLAVMTGGAVNLSGEGDPERLGAGRVSWTFLDTLGAQPLLGRNFRPEDDRFGSPRVAILSHALWLRRFGGDPRAVGRSLRLDGESVEIIGVMAPGFDCPYGIPNSELFVPLSLPPDLATGRGAWFLDCVGRMKPGATLAGVQQEMSGIAAGLEKAYPASNLGYLARVTALQDEVVHNARPTLLALLGAVAFVLLIACANVANLLLARSAGRERELALRMALGADRRRILTQLLAESLLLSLLGGAAGLLLARFSVEGLRYLLPFRTPALGLDPHVLAFTLGCSLLTTLVFGGLPALQASGSAPLEGLREGAKGSTGPVHRRLRGLLVGAEVALATALLAGAGLMIRSLWQLQRVDPGFQPKGVLTASLSLPQAKYPDAKTEQALEARLLERLVAIPGVKGAALNDTPPLGGSTSSSAYQIEGEPTPRVRPMAISHRVSLGYFQTLGIPLTRGRDFGPRDSQVAIISEAFARRHWPGRSPLGKRISMGGDQGPWMTILGVAGDVHQMGLADEPGLELYMPLLDPAQYGGPRGQAVSVLLRTEGNPNGWKAALKGALRDVDPEIPAGRLRTMEEWMARDLGENRAQSLLFSVFGLLALILATVGIYGVTSFLVAQRRREIGIRMALGARVWDVIGLVLGQGLGTVTVGAALGLAGSLMLGRLLQSQITGLGTADPLTLTAVLLLLMTVALLACLVPALRAVRVDPTRALRSE